MKIQPNYSNQTFIQKIQFEGYTRTKLGKSVDEFVKLKEPSSLQILNFLDDVKNFLNKKNRTKCLGAGFSGKVYKIDDKYVLKVMNLPNLELGVPKKNSELGLRDLKSYYGVPVLSLGRYCTILKNVSSNGKHISAGVPSNLSKYYTSNSQRVQYWNEEYLPKFANLPQKSFDALAKDFATLNKLGYTFDTQNPNNFVLVGKNKLRIVDEIDCAVIPNENTTAGLLRVFLELMDLDYYAPKGITNVALRCELIKKIILASEKHNLPAYRNNEDMKTWNCICEEFVETSQFLHSLRKIAQESPSLKIRLDKVKELLDETFVPDYLGSWYN